MRVTPASIHVLIPADLDAHSPRAQTFVEAGLQKLKQAETSELLETSEVWEVLRLVAAWSERIGVQIKRVQVRPMRNRWASCSSNGILTLSTDLLQLPLARWTVSYTSKTPDTPTPSSTPTQEMRVGSDGRRPGRA